MIAAATVAVIAMIAVDGIPKSMYGEPLQARVAFAAGDANCASSSMAGGPSGEEENVGWGQMFKNSREYTVLKKVVRLLQDNRLSTGDEETAQKLQDLNRSQSESYPILKTILNVIFITTGVVLLIAVVVVIIYTSIVKSDEQVNSVDSGHAEPFYEASHSPHHTPPPHLPWSAAQIHGPSSNRPQSAPVKTKLKCRYVPMVEEGQTVVKFGKMCFEVLSDVATTTIRSR